MNGFREAVRSGTVTFKQMAARVGKLRKAFPDVTGRALRQETEVEATEAKRRTPVDVTEDAPHPGLLRSTVHASGPFYEGRRLWCTISAGDLSLGCDYAAPVHENLTAIHKVGQAKYIESVILESRPYMAERVRKRIAFNKDHYDVE